MKYVIQLISKHTGETTWLGMKHETKEAAKAYFEKEVCARCNRVEYWPFDDDWKWVSRKEGFKPINRSLQDPPCPPAPPSSPI